MLFYFLYFKNTFFSEWENISPGLWDEMKWNEMTEKGAVMESRKPDISFCIIIIIKYPSILRHSSIISRETGARKDWGGKWEKFRTRHEWKINKREAMPGVKVIWTSIYYNMNIYFGSGVVNTSNFHLTNFTPCARKKLFSFFDGRQESPTWREKICVKLFPLCVEIGATATGASGETIVSMKIQKNK